MAKSSSPVVPEQMVGKTATSDNSPVEACLSASCFCLMDEDKKCVAVLHVKDGEPCVCTVDADGNPKHTKLSDIIK